MRRNPAAATPTRYVMRVLEERGWSLAVAESLTGGLLAARCVDEPGSGDVFAGGLVAYQATIKRGLLGVGAGPVISARCAGEMASGIARLLCVEVGLAVTGVAGPEGQEDQPVGLVFGACSVGGDTTSRRWMFPGPPEVVKRATVEAAIDLLADCLEQRASVGSSALTH